MQTKTKIQIAGIIIAVITVFSLGVMARPTIDTIKKNWNDMTKPKTYVVVDEDKVKLLERMKRPDNVQACEEMSRYQLAREEQIRLESESKEAGTKAINAYTAFSEKYEADRKKYNESVIKIINDVEKEAIRNTKM